MATKVLIGHIVVTQADIVDGNPSSFAADWEHVELKPGRYPLYLSFETGYTCPMPYWLLAKIDGIRVAGATYSAFGGNIFASRELPKEETTKYIQAYAYELPSFLEKGIWLGDDVRAKVELLENTAGRVLELTSDGRLDHMQNLSWDDVGAWAKSANPA